MKSLLRTLVSNKAPAYARTGLGAQLFGGAASPEALLKTYGSVGTLFAIVGRLANTTSTVNWGLYRGEEPVVNHPAAQLWRKPNPHQTQAEFVETFQQHLDLIGEAIWYVGRSSLGIGGPPLELWPIRPDLVTPVPDPDTFIKGWIYRAGREPMPWMPDEVIQLKMPNPCDPYRGLGPVQALLVDLDAERYSAEWNSNFFRNSAEPGGVVELSEHLDDSAWEEFTTRWYESHGGVGRSHRVAFLENAKWVPIGFTQRDMQFAQLRTLNREFIREAFGYPKPMLGSVENVNKANAEAGEHVFARWLIMPRLERIKQALNEKLLPMYGTSSKGLEFRYDKIIPADEEAERLERESDVKRVTELVKAGFDAQDALAFVGLPPLKFYPPSRPGG